MTAAAWPLLATPSGCSRVGATGRPGIAFGAVALVACAAVRPRHWQEPVALVLITLAVLGTASTVWTVGLVGESLRWGLVAAGYGASS